MKLSLAVLSRPQLDLDGKVCLVTGVGSGIGRATALVLGSLGAHVIVNDVNESAARATAALLDGGGAGNELAIGDVSGEAVVRSVTATAIRRNGGIDVLVSNAGIGQSGDLADLPVETIDRTIAVNLRSHVLCARAAVAAWGTKEVAHCICLLRRRVRVARRLHGLCVC